MCKENKITLFNNFFPSGSVSSTIHDKHAVTSRHTADPIRSHEYHTDTKQEQLIPYIHPLQTPFCFPRFRYIHGRKSRGGRRGHVPPPKKNILKNHTLYSEKYMYVYLHNLSRKKNRKQLSSPPLPHSGLGPLPAFPVHLTYSTYESGVWLRLS